MNATDKVEHVDVRDMVRCWLSSHGADGLCNVERGCCCIQASKFHCVRGDCVAAKSISNSNELLHMVPLSRP